MATGIVLSVTALATPGTPTALAGTGCDDAAISRDMGQRLKTMRCYTDWAYVTTAELGDSTSLLRRDNGVWHRYTGFPSTICKGSAAAEGVPARELSSFPAC